MRLKLVIIGLFLQFYPSPSKKEKHTHTKQTNKKTTKKSDFWKMKKKKKKKLLQITSFYTSVLKTTIVWGMVP